MKRVTGLKCRKWQWSREAVSLGAALLAYEDGNQCARVEVKGKSDESGPQRKHEDRSQLAWADVKARDEKGKTALMKAAELGDVKAINKLVERGAYVNARDDDYSTALMWAAIEGQVESIGALVRNGANVSVKDNNGKTALMWATGVGQVESIEALVRYGANVNAKDNNGYTALMWAAIKGQVESIGVLVRCGGDVNARKNNGLTALMEAQNQGYSSIVSLLKRYGAADNNDTNHGSNRGSGNGCFITTAVCEHTGKPDDCAELTELRRFRDHWLARQEGGKELIDEYYRIAPIIVEYLDRLENPGRELLERYIEPCVALSKKGQCEECLELYKSMVETLSRRYLDKA